MSYEVGEEVEVHAFGHWYMGVVVMKGRKRIHVRYTTGTGTTRVKVSPPQLIRKVEQEPVTLSTLPAPEVEEDHERACSFAGCGCPE